MFSSKSSFALVGLAGAIGFVSAQSISTACQAGLAGLVLNSGTACLNLEGLIGVVTAGSNSSLVDPLNSWLGGFCSQPLCSNDTISTVVSTLTSDCQTELTSLGIANVSSAQLTTLAQSVFPVAKQVACLQDQANNTLCVTESLNGYQSANGPITLSTISTLIGQLSGGDTSAASSIPTSVECANCEKQAYNIINQAFPGTLDQSTVSQTCGADFVNGQTPSGITQTANTAVQSSSSSTSGALTYAPGTAFSVLMTVASLFAIAA